MTQKSGKRRLGRECALKLLYQAEASLGLPSNTATLDSQMITFFNHFDISDKVATFASVLARGVVGNREQIDKIISENADNWRIERMDKIDRAVLRIAVYELFFAKELSKSIIINEAVDIAKAFGSEKSAAFVNGILDRIARGLEQ